MSPGFKEELVDEAIEDSTSDVDYFLRKLFGALRVPREYLGVPGEAARGSGL